MKKTNTSIIENEFQHRGASLEKGLSIKALRPFYEEIASLLFKLMHIILLIIIVFFPFLPQLVLENLTYLDI